MAKVNICVLGMTHGPDIKIPNVQVTFVTDIKGTQINEYFSPHHYMWKLLKHKNKNHTFVILRYLPHV